MRLKDRRKERSLTQANLAVLACLDQSSISRIEAGECRLAVSVAKKIAPFLGVNWWELYEDDDSPKEEGNE